jgi:hypothetical protein
MQYEGGGVRQEWSRGLSCVSPDCLWNSDHVCTQTCKIIEPLRPEAGVTNIVVYCSWLQHTAMLMGDQVSDQPHAKYAPGGQAATHCVHGPAGIRMWCTTHAAWSATPHHGAGCNSGGLVAGKHVSNRRPGVWEVTRLEQKPSSE